MLPTAQARSTLKQLLATDPTNRPALDLKAQVEHGNVDLPLSVQAQRMSDLASLCFEKVSLELLHVRGGWVCESLECLQTFAVDPVPMLP